MTRIDEDLTHRKCFPLCEVESKVRDTGQVRALNYLYLALCVYS
jgi:hypothetical protein